MKLSLVKDSGSGVRCESKFWLCHPWIVWHKHPLGIREMGHRPGRLPCGVAEIIYSGRWWVFAVIIFWDINSVLDLEQHRRCLDRASRKKAQGWEGITGFAGRGGAQTCRNEKSQGVWDSVCSLSPSPSIFALMMVVYLYLKIEANLLEPLACELLGFWFCVWVELKGWLIIKEK